ncbi:MAG TPA: helix-turn-helix transcriptional regulator [Anaerolineales bacterium]|nr:helix-turn-helix transcriptional regulator [Anaerolineales bacterium]
MPAFAISFGMEAEAVEPTPLPLDQAAEARADTQKLLSRWGSLTPRQRQVAALLAQEETSRGIAAHLGIAPATVRSHLSSVMRKLEANDRTDLRRQLASLDTHEWARPLDEYNYATP